MINHCGGDAKLLFLSWLHHCIDEHLVSQYRATCWTANHRRGGLVGGSAGGECRGGSVGAEEG